MFGKSISHIKNLRLPLLTSLYFFRELTQQHTGNRTRRLQCGYLVCFKVRSSPSIASLRIGVCVVLKYGPTLPQTPSDVKSLAHIAQSIRPETRGRDILACYREATSKPHGSLIICLQQPNQFMLRNSCMSECFDIEGVAVDDNGDVRLGGKYY